LIRYSLAKKLEDGNMAPGLSLKFMRDGVQSANMFALISLTGVKSDEFFSGDFTNNLPYPNMGLAEKLLFKKFTQASNCPLMLGINELALYDFSGNKYDDPKFPFQLIFRPQIKIGSCDYKEQTLTDLFTNTSLEGLTTIKVYA